LAIGAGAGEGASAAVGLALVRVSVGAIAAALSVLAGRMGGAGSLLLRSAAGAGTGEGASAAAGLVLARVSIGAIAGVLSVSAGRLERAGSPLLRSGSAAGTRSATSAGLGLVRAGVITSVVLAWAARVRVPSQLPKRVMMSSKSPETSAGTFTARLASSESGTAHSPTPMARPEERETAGGNPENSRKLFGGAASVGPIFTRKGTCDGGCVIIVAGAVRYSAAARGASTCATFGGADRSGEPPGRSVASTS
jgi:hypothetical protein